MVSDVTTTQLIQEAAETGQQGLGLAEDFTQFLNLLTLQLQNQDPLNPTDTDKLTDQITQFSQVEQQLNTNQKLDDLLALQLSSLSSVGLGYVGLNASYLSADMAFDGSTPINITYNIGETVADSTINIYDETGTLVYSERGEKSIGQKSYVWDGRINEEGTEFAEKGTYSVTIDNVSPEGKTSRSQTVVTGIVRGIENQNGVVFLLIGERAVPISNVINASVPETAAIDDTGVDDTEGTEDTGEDDSENSGTEDGEGESNA